jgi:hypothetical protein
MFRLTKTNLSLIVLAIFVILGTSYLLFLPFQNIRKAIGLEDKRYQNEEIIINSYNPIVPRISIITKVEDGYLVTVEDYARNGLDTFAKTGKVNGIQKGEGFGIINSKVTGKTLEETKQIVQNQDQSKSPFTPEKSQLEKDYIEEQKKPVECRKLLQLNSSRTNLNEYSFIYKNISFREFGKIIQEKQLNSNESFGYINSRKEYVQESNIAESNSEVIKIRFTWNQEPNENNDYTGNLIKFEKVYSDCHTEEIPLQEKPQ